MKIRETPSQINGRGDPEAIIGSDQHQATPQSVTSTDFIAQNADFIAF